MAVPYSEIFLGLLVVYMVYSEWAGLDSRYLIAGGLVLLVVTAVADAAGSIAAANAFAVYVFYLLAGGVVLLVVDQIRAARRGSSGGSGPGGPTPVPSAQPVDERERAADHPLDRPEE